MKLRKNKGFVRIVVGLMIILMLFSSTPITTLANAVESEENLDSEVVSANDEVSQNQSNNASSYTTLSDPTYIVDQIIPDAAFRQLIMSEVDIPESQPTNSVKQSQLDQVTWIKMSGYESGVAIQSIQGIEYLTNLETVLIQYNRIKRLDNIDWSKLKKLRYLDFNGNDISTSADFSGATELSIINLNDNLLSDAFIRSMRSTTKEICGLTANNQRTNGLEVIAEDTYYSVSGNTTIIVILKGVRLDNSTSAIIKIDNTVMNFQNNGGYSGNVWELNDAPLSPGPHTLEVTVGSETKSESFSIEPQKDIFFDKLIMNSDEKSFFVILYSMQGIDLNYDEIRLVSKFNPNISIADMTNSMFFENAGYVSRSQYKKINSYLIYAYKMNQTRFYFNSRLKTIPVGDYDLQFIKDNQVTKTIDSVLEVVDKKAILNYVHGASGYEQTGNYLFVRLFGSYLDPAKLIYEVKEGNLSLPVHYESFKKTYDGYIVKLKRDNWSFVKGEQLYMTVSATEGYELLNFSSRLPLTPRNGIYYTGIDVRNSRFELAFTNNYAPKKVKVVIEQLENANSIQGIEIATGEMMYSQGGFVNIPLTDQNGNIPEFKYKYYKYRVFFDEVQVIEQNAQDILMYTPEGQGESWYVEPKTIVGTKELSFSYDSVLSYDTYAANKDGLSVIVTNEQDETIQDIDISEDNRDVNAFNSNGVLHLYGSINGSELKVGTYKIKVRFEDNELSSKFFQIIPNDTFLIDYISTSWINETTFQINLATRNVSEDDQYNVELIDPMGNPVNGLTTIIDQKNSSQARLLVSGLKKSTAYRKYWVKITHKTLGLPYKLDQQTPFYSDDKGEYIDIYSQGDRGVSDISNSFRTTGIRNYTMKHPITISAYLPYNTKPVASMTETKEKYPDIYFTAAFISALPNKNRLYDLVVKDAEGRIVEFEGKCLGLDERMVNPVPLTSISVSPKTLLLAPLQSEQLRVSHTPSNTTFCPSEAFQSSNEEVATVNDRGIVTAVAEGNAIITASYGSYKSTCDVKVVERYTISFDPKGGTPQSEKQVLWNGNYLDESSIHSPMKKGYRFIGWYAGEDELNVLNPVNSNKMYEAKWELGEVLAVPTANYSNDKVLVDGAVIKLMTQEPDTTIYYTLDGTTPSENSTLYKGQITLKKTIEGDQPITIKAIATKEEYNNSEVVTYTYLLKDSIDDLGEIKPEDIPEGSMEPNLWVAGLKTSYIYTGSYIKPSVRVYDENRLLTLNKDYTLTYKNAKYAGMASLTITGKGNYYSSKTYFYAIQPKPLTQDDITAVNPILFANGKVQKLIPSVKDGTKKLSYNKDGKKDFTVSYEADPVDGEPAYKVPGKYKITINGTNNYTGSIDVVETILDKKTQYLISKSSVAKIPTQIFTGDDITPTITVKYGKTPLVLNEDYKLTYRNNMAVGTATILIQGMGDYHGTKQVSFKIQGKDMRYVKVTSGWVGSFLYESGKTSYEQENLVLGYQKSTKVPSEEVPTQAYSVYYVKNQGVGIATAIFTGNPAYGYSGTMKKIFKISPNLDFANAEITYDDEVTYLKGGCYPSVSVSLNDVTLVAGKDYTVSYTYNKAVCLDPTVKYAPTITVKGKGNYKGSKQVKFTITQASLADLTMVASDRVFTGKANAFATSVSIYDTNGKALVADRDYGKVLTYWVNGVQLTKTDVVAEGATVVVRATGKNSYTGTLETSFRVIKKENLLPYAKATIPNQVYTGSPITLQKSDITVTVKQGLQTVTLTSNDFEIVGYSKNTAKGTATVILKGVGTYGGIKKVTFKITAREVIDYII